MNWNSTLSISRRSIPRARLILDQISPSGEAFRLRVAPGENRIYVDVSGGTGAPDRLYPAGEPPGVPVTLNEGETKAVTLRVDREVLEEGYHRHPRKLGKQQKRAGT